MKYRTGSATIAGIALATTLGAANAQELQAGDWLLRLGASNVIPDESTGKVRGPLSDALAGTHVGIDRDWQPSLTLTYMITGNWAVELLGSTPFDHELTLEGGALDGTRFGQTDVLPPTLSVQYHFDTGSRFKPYLGVGVNHAFFFDQDLDGEAAAIGVDGFDLDDSVNPAFQVGIDVGLRDSWYFNADLRYIGVDTDARIFTADGVTESNIDVDPWVPTIALGYRF